ncbi:hypothetical protein GOODEAATRI_003278 [Goodea atripinnis]|uniref:Uncharacterized protein n=1 Tax=Goodea atripinnis TaxID=208336 RepID=A0ABV0MYB7_9TELE
MSFRLGIVLTNTCVLKIRANCQNKKRMRINYLCVFSPKHLATAFTLKAPTESGVLDSVDIRSYSRQTQRGLQAHICWTHPRKAHTRCHTIKCSARKSLHVKRTSYTNQS